MSNHITCTTNICRDKSKEAKESGVKIWFRSRGLSLIFYTTIYYEAIIFNPMESVYLMENWHMKLQANTA